MSERQPTDHYVTPPEIAKWAIEHCIELIGHFNKDADVSGLRMLEPGSGKKAPFLTYAIKSGISAVLGIELESNRRGFYLEASRSVIFGDYLSDKVSDMVGGKYDIIATNPPFKHGEEFIKKSLELLAPYGIICFLQKLSFMSSQGRYQFFQDYPPYEINVLSARPSFTGKGTDNQEYGLYVWVGSEIAKKVRKKWGKRSIIRWHRNKDWTV